MLVGGLNILGICVCATSDSMKSRSGVVLQLLKNLPALPTNATKIPDKVVLYYCTKTNKLSCKTFDNQLASNPADLKFQDKLADTFCCLETSFKIDIPVFSNDRYLCYSIYFVDFYLVQVIRIN
jgi:hypothetical protein